jgi:hypothetical protein
LPFLIRYFSEPWWRFNALQLLDEYDCLNAELITVIKQKEEDYEILEWLQDL